MRFVGTATCKDENEILDILGKMATMPTVNAIRRNMDLIVEYEPKDTETSREEEETIARLTDILEAVEYHGICVF